MTGAKPVARRSPDFTATLNDAIPLQTDRAFRDVRGQFFIEGVRNFVSAVENRFTIDRIVVSERLLIVPVARQWVRRCRRAGVETQNVSPEQFRQLSQAKRASGIAALVRQSWTPLDKVSPDQGLAWIVSETVRAPGNLGTLIRTSLAAGGAGFIFIGNRIDPYGPDVVRASMGAIYRQTFVRTDWTELRDWVRRCGRSVIGASPDGVADLHGITFDRSPLLFLGEERKGLTQRQKGLCTELVRIPMEDGTNSLNVGVAGSLLLYEVYRNHADGKKFQMA